MTVQFSTVSGVKTRQMGGFEGVKYVDVDSLGVGASPLAVVDDFRVRTMPFSPHPHAGFSAVTYVFEDSPVGVRSRSSLGVDVVVGPGGVVWTQAGRGCVHEEAPAESDRELHGLQLFVNLSAHNKLAQPTVFALKPDDVPVWEDPTERNRVRVVTGSYAGVSSRLIPVEPFTFLDIRAGNPLSYTVGPAHNTVLYVLSGEVRVSAEMIRAHVAAQHAVAIRASDAGGSVAVDPAGEAHLLILSGARIGDPVVTEGPFIMNSRAQIEEANARFRAGDMGSLAPLPR